MNKNLVPVIAGVVALTAGIFLGRGLFGKKSEAAETKQGAVQQTNSSYSLINPFLDCIDAHRLDMRELQLFKPEITSYIDNVKKKYSDIYVSYYFRDLNNGVWMGINEKEVFSPASLMKVPVMIALLKEAETNPGILGERVRYEKKKFEQVDEDSGVEKQDGSEYSIEEYLRQMIVNSDNASTIILLDKVGFEKVSKVQKDLNLYVEGLTDPNANFVAVNRYSGVFRILFNASYLNKDMSEKALRLLSETVYNKGIREAVPEKYAVAHKYGERDFFDEAGNRNTLQLHHFGIVFYTGKPYLLGIMTRGANREVKEKIIYDLARITFNEVDKQMK
ncbi:MAG: serine hydrolase [Bacteroidota bacterium]